MPTREARRYETVKNFRVEAVERAYLFPHNPLYRRINPADIDPGSYYSQCSLPLDKHGKPKKFRTVEEALAAVRKRLDTWT